MTPGTPAAEIEITSDLVRRLLAAQHADLAGLALNAAASGWDNTIFRLGDSLTVRLPRRAAAAALVLSEQRWLPLLAGGLPLKIPVPLRTGVPQDQYPWPWSITPWFEGETADLDPPGPDQGEIFGDFFTALHKPAPEDAPRNPVRGVPLVQRRSAFDHRVASLAGRGEPLDPRLWDIWQAALSEPLDVAPAWIHGDPHPRNVLVSAGRIVAVLDWGDLGQGDRATDLAAIWMLLQDAGSRERAIAACQDVTAATWRRARGWAVFYGVMLLETGLADDPRMAAIARKTLRNVIAGPACEVRPVPAPPSVPAAP